MTNRQIRVWAGAPGMTAVAIATAVACVTIAGLGASALPAQAPSATTIPLKPGLTIVTAIATDAGDGESIKRIDRIDAQGVHIRYSADIERKANELSSLLESFGGAAGGSSNQKQRVRVNAQRTVRMIDLKSARHYQLLFGEGQPAIFRDTTALGTSTAVLTELKTTGSAVFSCQCATGVEAMAGNLGTALGGLLAGAGATAEAKELANMGKLSGTLRRVEPGPLPVPVLVNNLRVDLPAIHAKGRLDAQDVEFFFLDDPEHPISLRWQVGSQRLQVIKISFPAVEATQQIATALEKTGRVEVYGIYFDFGSATIKPESEPVLKEIADTLVKNPAWKLSVEGHTDNVGGDAANLDLSRRRSAAVKNALVTGYSIAADRLTTAGFGASRPKETNDTLDGRARNRRVELVRR